MEAIANGVPLFREPRQARPKQTELLLGVLLGVMLLGLAVLVQKFHVGPRSGQTVLSQVMAYSVGRGWAYYIVSLSITVVLGLAACDDALVTIANGRANSGYVPNDASFGAFTFQVLGSSLKPGCAEDSIVNGFVDLIQASGK